MILVTLEGLPHAGRSCILRNLVRLCPDWAAANVLPDPATACAWASPTCRSSHALFASLLRKTTALRKTPASASGTLLLNSPWFEHMPHHRPLWDLMADATRELVRCQGVEVDAHVMIMLQVPHDETFEQMVCCGNSYWNGVSLHDVIAAQGMIGQMMQRAKTTPGAHPFPCATFTIRCPPFFEENEVVAQAIARDIVTIVRAQAQDLKRRS